MDCLLPLAESLSSLPELMSETLTQFCQSDVLFYEQRPGQGHSLWSSQFSSLLWSPCPFSDLWWGIKAQYSCPSAPEVQPLSYERGWVEGVLSLFDRMSSRYSLQLVNLRGLEEYWWSAPWWHTIFLTGCWGDRSPIFWNLLTWNGASVWAVKSGLREKKEGHGPSTINLHYSRFSGIFLNRCFLICCTSLGKFPEILNALLKVFTSYGITREWICRAPWAGHSEVGPLFYL